MANIQNIIKFENGPTKEIINSLSEFFIYPSDSFAEIPKGKTVICETGTFRAFAHNICADSCMAAIRNAVKNVV